MPLRSIHYHSIPHILPAYLRGGIGSNLTIIPAFRGNIACAHLKVKKIIENKFMFLGSSASWASGTFNHSQRTKSSLWAFRPRKKNLAPPPPIPRRHPPGPSPPPLPETPPLAGTFNKKPNRPLLKPSPPSPYPEQKK